MTDNKKRVQRRTGATVFSRGTRRIIVSIEPNNQLGFRLERTRKTYYAPIEQMFNTVAMWEVDGKRRLIEKRVKELIKQGATRRQAKSQARQERE